MAQFFKYVPLFLEYFSYFAHKEFAVILLQFKRKCLRLMSIINHINFNNTILVYLGPNQTYATEVFAKIDND